MDKIKADIERLREKLSSSRRPPKPKMLVVDDELPSEEIRQLTSEDLSVFSRFEGGVSVVEVTPFNAPKLLDSVTIETVNPSE